jgi:hypothetical protein
MVKWRHARVEEPDLVSAQRYINLKSNVLNTCTSAISLDCSNCNRLPYTFSRDTYNRRLEMLKWVLLMPLVLVQWHSNLYFESY